MNQTIVETPNIMHGTVSFNRRVSVRPYEAAEAGIYIQFDIPSDPSMSDEQRTAQIVANARAAFFQAKALVLEELALEFKVGPNGVIHEVLSEKFGKVSEVVPSSAPAAVAAPAPAAAVGAAPTAPANNTLGVSPSQLSTARDSKDIEQELIQDLLANPEGWYDNRLTKTNPKGPCFKRKSDGKALWVRG